MSSEIIDQVTVTDVPRSWRPDSKVSACFLGLYRNILVQSASAEPPHVLGVTSLRRGEGVTTVAGRLALAAAHDGDQKVLLVDANPMVLAVDPTIAKDLADQSANESQSLDQALRPSPLENLLMLPLAAAFPGPPSLDGQRRAQELLRDLAFEFSFIVVDLPPLDELGAEVDALAIDGMLVVITAACTRRSLAHAARKLTSYSRLLGAVLNLR